MTPDPKLMEEARLATRASHDPRTAVGCVVHHSVRGVLVRAANRVPPGLTATESMRLEAPAKYQWIEHAERSALLAAARDGIAVAGATIYVHGGFPCAECARAIVATGIVAVVYDIGASDIVHWEESYRTSRLMFEEAGISVLGVTSTGSAPSG